MLSWIKKWRLSKFLKLDRRIPVILKGKNIENLWYSYLKNPQPILIFFILGYFEMNSWLHILNFLENFHIFQSCANVSRMYRLGDGVEHSEAKSLEFKQKAQTLMEELKNA